MLKYILTFTDKSEVPLDCVLSARLDCELDVPADSLSVTVAYEDKLRKNADFISAYSDGSRVFAGQIDEIIELCGSGKRLLRFSARSLAAQLLDNEAEPLVYSNPSSSMMLERHLRPFGVTSCDEERHPIYDSLRIDKGMSHWQVLESYCAKRYGATPRIAGTRAYLKGFRAEGEEVFGTGGHRIIEMNDSLRRYKLISETRVKLTNTGGYESRLVNGNPDAACITRVRYVNAAADNVSLNTARGIIDKGNKEARMVKIKCAGDLTNVLGKAAVINGEKGFLAEGLSYRLSDSGEFTTVSLRKES